MISHFIIINNKNLNLIIYSNLEREKKTTYFFSKEFIYLFLTSWYEKYLQC